MTDQAPSKDVSRERLNELIEDRQRFVSYLEAGGGDPDLDDALNMARDLVTALQKLQRAENEPAAGDLDIMAQLLRGEPLSTPTLQAAGATIRVLREENARLRAAQPPDPDEGATDHVEALGKMVEAGLCQPPSDDSKDAERYRWMYAKGLKHADVCLSEDDDGPVVQFRATFYLPDLPDAPYEDGDWTREQFDAAIDAARATATKRAGHRYWPREGTEVCGICGFHKREHAPEHMPTLGESGDR